MKKTVALLLTLVLLCGLFPVVHAASNEALAADTLYTLGLFQGTGLGDNGRPIYSLDRAPNRQEAVTMLVRLLGREDEALSGTWSTPFTDLDEWAKPYVGYAYENGLTTGTGAASFSGNRPASAAMYLTFVLRALGYASGQDFEWATAWTLSDALGLTSGQYKADNNIQFKRADVALVSKAALTAKLKSSEKTLLDSLVARGAVTEGAVITSCILGKPETVRVTVPVTKDENGARYELYGDNMKKYFPDYLSCLLTYASASSALEEVLAASPGAVYCIANRDAIPDIPGLAIRADWAWRGDTYSDFFMAVIDDSYQIVAWCTGQPIKGANDSMILTFNLCQYDTIPLCDAAFAEFSEQKAGWTAYSDIFDVKDVLVGGKTKPMIVSNSALPPQTAQLLFRGSGYMDPDPTAHELFMFELWSEWKLYSSPAAVATDGSFVLDYYFDDGTGYEGALFMLVDANGQIFGYTVVPYAR